VWGACGAGAVVAGACNRSKRCQAGGGARTCPEAANNLAASIDSSSRRYIERSRRQLSTRDVHTRGRHASAKLLSGRKLLLAKVGHRWLISDPSLRG
jgi:hypothetical protein